MKRKYIVLDDDEIATHLSMNDAIESMRQVFHLQSKGLILAPPRQRVELPPGGFAFTVGAQLDSPSRAGFRAYDLFPSQRGTDQDQIVAVYDMSTGRLEGLVIGSLLGVMRTAAINGVAIDQLASVGATSLGILGAGFQSRWHLRAAMSVRKFEHIRIHNRSIARALALADEAREEYGCHVDVVDTARDVVSESEVVLCLTSSPTPLFKSEWVRPGTHITTIGPKTTSAHELPQDILQVADIIVTDSLAQTMGYANDFFIGTNALVELGEVVSGSVKRLRPEDITVFCSVGLAGTEVALASVVIDKLNAQSD